MRQSSNKSTKTESATRQGVVDGAGLEFRMAGVGVFDTRQA
jgi:hypothetical protein